MPGNIGFYYPQTVFQDDWIKLAALYWDKIARIKWKSSPLGDSDTVRQLADEAEFIVNLTPSSEEVTFVSDSFLAAISKHSEILREHYSRVYRRVSLEKRLEITFDLSTLIDGAFMTPQLGNFILDRGLGTLIGGGGGFRHPNGRHFRVDVVNNEVEINPPEISFDDLEGGLFFALQLYPELYLVYMRSLAEKLAIDNRMHLVTDKIFDHVASSGCTTERILQVSFPSGHSQPHFINSRPTADELEFQMAALALRSVLPKDISGVSVKQIIKLRKSYHTEMMAFQECIYSFAADLKELQDIPDVRALRAHLEVEYERRLKPQLDDLQKCLGSIGIDTVMGALNIRVAIPPVLASTLLAGTGTLLHFNPLNPLVIGAGAIAFSLFPVIHKKQQEAGKIVRSSPAAYLLHIREALEPARAATQVVRHARQIFSRQ